MLQTHVSVKKIKVFLIFFIGSFLFYLTASFLLTDGKVILYSSFIDENDTSQIKPVDNFDFKFEGDSLIKYSEDFSFKNYKRYERKHYGIFFYWTQSKPEWRTLLITLNRNSPLYNQQICLINNHLQGGDLTGGDSKYIHCNINDTIDLDYFRCFDKVKLGKLTICVR